MRNKRNNRNPLRNPWFRRTSIAILVALALANTFQWVTLASAAGHFNFEVIRRDEKGWEVRVTNPGCPEGWNYKTKNLSGSWEDGDNGETARAWCEREVPDPKDPTKTIKEKCWESSKWVDNPNTKSPTRDPNVPTRTPRPTVDCPLCTETPTEEEKTATPTEEEKTATPTEVEKTTTATPPGGGDTATPQRTATSTSTSTSNTATPTRRPPGGGDNPTATTIVTTYLDARVLAACRADTGLGADVDLYVSPNLAKAYNLGDSVSIYAQYSGGTEIVVVTKVGSTDDGSIHYRGTLQSARNEVHFLSVEFDKVYSVNVIPFCITASTATVGTSATKTRTPVIPRQEGSITPNAGFAADVDMAALLAENPTIGMVAVNVFDPEHAYDLAYLAGALISALLAILLTWYDRQLAAAKPRRRVTA